jgi:ATP-binding cassette subfamily C (CFTR/MRP) protein 1
MSILVSMHPCLKFVLRMPIQTALIDMLYRKSLRVSVAARSHFGVGHVVNLQSNDAAKLWWLPPFLHVLWSGPLMVRPYPGLSSL